MIGVFEGIEIGSWYRIPGGASFEVVALDMDTEAIEIQYYDGAVEEVDFDSWLEMRSIPTAAPNDSAGALDLNRGDYGNLSMDYDARQPGDRVNPLDQLDWH
ncbi:MAG: DUF6763 family protein [Oceanococcus sp.]